MEMQILVLLIDISRMTIRSLTKLGLVVDLHEGSPTNIFFVMICIN